MSNLVKRVKAVCDEYKTGFKAFGAYEDVIELCDALERAEAENAKLEQENDYLKHAPHTEDQWSALTAKLSKADIVCAQLERWRNAWASQDTSDAEPARKAMFKALDYYLEHK